MATPTPQSRVCLCWALQEWRPAEKLQCAVGRFCSLLKAGAGLPRYFFPTGRAAGDVLTNHVDRAQICTRTPLSLNIRLPFPSSPCARFRVVSPILLLRLTCSSPTRNAAASSATFNHTPRLYQHIPNIMSFMGGAECSTAANPLSQFQKHVQDDKTLQRDRLVGRGPGGQMGGFRSQAANAPQDEVRIPPAPPCLVSIPK